ncbi:MAG: hypothetical protein ABIS50_08435 [Luteolibacter sp.]|uniref:hypothetical protein n=1 Tax=Luteolibacter sp. TaxID=1962973 RepID=UPI0032678BB4
MALPIINLADLDIPSADLTQIEAALLVLETKLKPHFVPLTAQQRSNFTKMGTREQLVRQAVTAAQQNSGDLPTSIGTAAAVADVVALDKYRPLFARVQALAEGCDDTEMAIGIDLMNFSLRVYGQLKLSASDSLKGLLESLGSFFGGGRRAATPASTP